MVTTHHLRAFRLVVETGGVTRAAERMNKPQPYVSRLLAQLEDAVGFPLFGRHGRKLLPNERGLRLFAEVARALDNMEEVFRVANDLRQQATTQLRILATPHASHAIVPPVLKQLVRERPDVRVSLDVVARTLLPANVSLRAYDVGIAVLPLDVPTVRVEPAGVVSLVAVFPKGHALAARAMVDPIELSNYPFVALTRNTAMAKVLSNSFEELSRNMHIRCETVTSALACDLVAAGVGVSIVDAMTAAKAAHSGVEFRPLINTVASDVGLFYPADRAANDLSRRFAEIARSVIQDAEALVR